MVGLFRCNKLSCKSLTRIRYEENSKKRGKKIRVASEVATKAEAIGEFSLILHIVFRLRLHYVPYVPSTKENLVSISS